MLKHTTITVVLERQREGRAWTYGELERGGGPETEAEEVVTPPSSLKKERINNPWNDMSQL